MEATFADYHKCRYIDISYDENVPLTKKISGTP